jgi:glyoxylase-like metal-dependent hydrolase (beta-lactamase superfamily II)
MKPVIKPFYDARTSTLTYAVYDPKSRDAVVIDTVLDYEPVGSKTWTESVDALLKFLDEEGLKLHYVLETHAHADHLSGAQLVKKRHPNAKLAIGKRITEVQTIFKEVFDLPEDFPTDGRQFDRLLEDGEFLEAGTLRVETLFTPGHTPACATYRIDDAIFTGDALFMPDQGTGRCDFPGGSAEDMYRSVHDRLYRLPDETRVFVGHDYQPGGREVRFETTIGEQKRANVQLDDATTKEAFVAARKKRDASLAAPKLLFQSVQVNVDAGKLPRPTAAGRRYPRTPVNVFRPEPDPEAGDLRLETVEGDEPASNGGSKPPPEARR